LIFEFGGRLSFFGFQKVGEVEGREFGDGGGFFGRREGRELEEGERELGRGLVGVHLHLVELKHLHHGNVRRRHAVAEGHSQQRQSLRPSLRAQRLLPSFSRSQLRSCRERPCQPLGFGLEIFFLDSFVAF
jgi:hypothetical protein